MTDARAQILGQIRAALRGVPEVALPPAEPLLEGTPYRAAIARSLVDRFIRTAEALGVQVRRTRSPELPTVLAEVLRACGAERVALSEDLKELADALREMGVEVGGPEVAPGAPVGITGAEFGVAETGTLVVRSGGGRRTASLLPPVHVAVLPEDRLLPDLDALFERVGRSPLPSAVTLITGPSRTADIEQTLTPGVHGPGKVYIVLLEDTPNRTPSDRPESLKGSP